MYVKTDNISFLKVREYLQSQYIENNQFMLRLENENLKDLNLESLYNMNSNDEDRKATINLISEECRENVWFFFRELMPMYSHIDMKFYTPGTKISEMPRFILTPLACELIYMYENGMNFAIIMSRLSNEERAYVKNIITILAFYEYTFRMEPGTMKYPFHLGDEGSIAKVSYYRTILDNLISLFLEYNTSGLVSASDICKAGGWVGASKSAVFHAGSIMNDINTGNLEKEAEYSNIFRYLLDTLENKDCRFFGLIDDTDTLIDNDFNKISHYSNKYLYDNIFSENYLGKTDREVASMIYDNQGEIIPRNKIRLIDKENFTTFI